VVFIKQTTQKKTKKKKKKNVCTLLLFSSSSSLKFCCADLSAGHSILHFEEGREFGGLALAFLWTLFSQRASHGAAVSLVGSAPVYFVVCVIAVALYWRIDVWQRGDTIECPKSAAWKKYNSSKFYDEGVCMNNNLEWKRSTKLAASTLSAASTSVTLFYVSKKNLREERKKKWRMTTNHWNVKVTKQLFPFNNSARFINRDGAAVVEIAFVSHEHARDILRAGWARQEQNQQAADNLAHFTDALKPLDAVCKRRGVGDVKHEDERAWHDVLQFGNSYIGRLAPKEKETKKGEKQDRTRWSLLVSESLPGQSMI
jgi:hypothetical protein